MGKMILGAVVVVAVIGFVVMRGNKAAAPASMQTDTKSTEMQPGENAVVATPSTEEAAEAPADDTKNFAMTSYYDEKGKWFSLKEIEVKKGDKVRIKVTNTKGMHDFVIDEYGIKQETPLDETTVIEFTADKAGEFVYYCSKPGHREGGQWGTLKVTE